MPYKDPEKKKANSKAWQEKNKEKVKAQKAIYRSQPGYKEKQKAYMDEYMKVYGPIYEAKPERRFSSSRWQANKRSLEFSISLEEFITETAKPCVYCNNLLGKKSTYASGLDRKDNAIGYTAGNICSCCWICNSIKGEHLTFDEMKEVVKLIINMRNLNE